MSKNVKSISQLGEIKGYRLIKDEYLADVDSLGLVFEHEKSGARICVISNDDDNKVFSIAFRTPPEDSTGAPHIIEHTVLCGSDKYPAKDPFMQLAKGSLNTFLNAMTYPDKTIYPVASCNDHDFENLMSVYMDAVLRPNIYKHKEIFMQEGWHYEIDENGNLDINGVVYSEMRGVVSSPENALYEEINKALYPDTAYGKSSGGDPDVIPSLRYEDYLDFHRRHYHPSNSYIMLWGDIDVEERLAWMDKNYLSSYDKTDVSETLPGIQKPLGVREITRHYSVAEDDDNAENEAFLSYVTSVCDSLNPSECLAWDLISEVLLNTPGAPLKQALIDAGIGEEVYGEFLDHMRQPAFSIVAKNTSVENKEKFIEIVKSELEKAASGLDHAGIEAAINNREFFHREADFGSMSRGLYTVIDMMQSWLYDDSRVFDYVKWNDVYAELRVKLQSGYFEKLIKSKLLIPDNAIFMIFEAEKGMTERKSAELKEKLAEYKKALSKDELEKIIAEKKALDDYQNAPVTAEEINCIPFLSREDIKIDVKPFSNTETKIGRFDGLRHGINTNGIAYISFLFDIDGAKAEWLPYIGLLSSLLSAMNTEHYSYLELSNEIKANVGRLDFGVENYNEFGKADSSKLRFVASVSALSDKVEKSAELLTEIATKTVFADTKRLKELLLEIKSETQANIASRGNSLAAGRMLSYFTKTGKKSELIGGIDCYDFVCDALEHFDERAEKLAKSFENVCRYVFNPEKLMISAGCDDNAFSALEKALAPFGEALNENVIAEPDESLLTGILANVGEINPIAQNEGFMTPSQVNFLVRGGNLINAGYRYNGIYRVLSRIISYEYLYKNIRMKGGAYGCGCSIYPDTGNVIFFSYRDPKLSETRDIYLECPEWVEKLDMDEKELTRNVVGSFSALDRPFSARMLVNRSLMAYMTGRNVEDALEERRQMLGTTIKQLHESAEMLHSIMAQGYTSVVGNTAQIKENSDMFASCRVLN